MASLEAAVQVAVTELRSELVAVEVMQDGQLVQAFVADPSRAMQVGLPRRLDAIYGTAKVR